MDTLCVQNEGSFVKRQYYIEYLSYFFILFIFKRYCWLSELSLCWYKYVSKKKPYIIHTIIVWAGGRWELASPFLTLNSAISWHLHLLCADRNNTSLLFQEHSSQAINMYTVEKRWKGSSFRHLAFILWVTVCIWLLSKGGMFNFLLMM